MTIEAVRTPATDPAAWVGPLSTGLALEDQIERYPRFTLRVPHPAGALALARGRHASLCVVSQPPGAPEAGPAAYDDDAIWLVLAGEATFRNEDGQEVAHLGHQQGLLTPKGEPYSYQNAGDGLLVMLRGAGRRDPVEGSRASYRGDSPGGTEAISWRREPWAGVNAQPEPFKRFDLRFPLRGENVAAWRVLARSERIAIHSSSLEPSRGEVNLHAHDDEAIWVVLFGEVTFFGPSLSHAEPSEESQSGEESQELATLHANDGIMIPQDTLYRYVNTGDGYLHMLRFGGRGEPAPPLAVGS